MSTVVLRLKNYDKTFNETTNEKFLLNHEDMFSQENKEKLDSFIMKNYSEDNLSMIPSCNCGELKGTYYVGDDCSKCGSTVKNSVDEGLSFLVWAEQPVGVAPFISPMMLAILNHRYKLRKFNIPAITYIMLPGVRIDARYARASIPDLEKLNFLLEKEGIKRGYNSFVENFVKIIRILEDNFGKGNKAEREEFFEWVMENRDEIFSQYLPFPNKSVFTIDSNELGSFIDRSLLEPLNAMRRMTGIDIYKNTPQQKQAKVARSLLELSSFYIKYIENSFFKKPGLIRQHISSTRSHFTMRAVITSMPGVHTADEIHLPWSASCTLFREHLLKGLYKRGYSYKQAVNHLLFHNRIYCPVVDEIFNEILAAAPGGIEVLLNRNPSLHRGSVQTVRVTRFKTNPDDNTISMSYLIAPSYNADYDGDSLNLMLILTKKARDQLNNFKPHHSVLALTGPNEFGNAIQYPKTIISTLANWYNVGSRN